MEYRCRVGTPAGHVFEDVFVAETEDRLRRDLEQRGLCVISIHRRRLRDSLTAGRNRRHTGGVPDREFQMFNQELATLLKAGMPLVQSLNILRDRASHPTFRRVMDQVHDAVRSGSSLSDACAAHPSVFPGAYVASLLAGEKSGSLDTVLRRYVAYMKVLGTVRRKTLAALIYPAVLTGLSVIVVAIIVLKVVPEFAAFYDSFGARLPMATRVIVGGSTFLRAHVWWLVAAAVAGGIAAWSWLKAPGQRARFDRLILRVPWLGSTALRFATSQAARTLATLLGGGLPLVQAIEIAARSISNQFLADELLAVGARVREGTACAEAMRARAVFPDVAIKMVEVGEATGALQDMLASLADFFDEEIEGDLSRFVALVEPLLLIVMGLVIAGLLLALYMPLFGLTSVIGGPVTP